MGSSVFDGFSRVTMGDQTVDQSGGKGVATTYPVHNFQIRSVRGLVKRSVCPANGSPIILRCCFDAAKRSGYCLEVRVVGNGSIDHRFEAFSLQVRKSFVDSFEKMVESDAKRWVQEVSGYELTIISGIVTHEGGVPSGALPGRLVRNPRTAAVREAGQVTEVDLEELLVSALKAQGAPWA